MLSPFLLCYQYSTNSYAVKTFLWIVSFFESCLYKNGESLEGRSSIASSCRALDLMVIAAFASRIAAPASSNRAITAATLRCLEALARHFPEQKRGGGPNLRLASNSCPHILHHMSPSLPAARAHQGAKKKTCKDDAISLRPLSRTPLRRRERPGFATSLQLVSPPLALSLSWRGIARPDRLTDG